MKVLLIALLTASIGFPLLAADDNVDAANNAANAFAADDLDLAAAEEEADLEIAATCDCALDVAACRAQGYSCAEYCEGKDIPECAANNDDYTKAEAEETLEEDFDIFES
jgi:hypothetical protein